MVHVNRGLVPCEMLRPHSSINCHRLGELETCQFSILYTHSIHLSPPTLMQCPRGYCLLSCRPQQLPIKGLLGIRSFPETLFEITIQEKKILILHDPRMTPSHPNNLSPPFHFVYLTGPRIHPRNTFPALAWGQFHFL